MSKLRIHHIYLHNVGLVIDVWFVPILPATLVFSDDVIAVSFLFKFGDSSVLSALRKKKKNAKYKLFIRKIIQI